MYEDIKSIKNMQNLILCSSSNLSYIQLHTETLLLHFSLTLLCTHTPFRLVYGQEAVMPMEYIVPSLKISAFTEMDDPAMLNERLARILELEENRFIAGFQQQVQKAREKAWHDRQIKKKHFQNGDLVLLYDSKFMKFPGKLKTHWKGP